MNPLLSSIDDCLLTVKVYQRDVKVHFSALNAPPFVSEPEQEARKTKRSKIVKFSKRSAKRLRFTVRNSEDVWKSFVTLTYPEYYPCDGKMTKGHLNAFLQYLRRKKIKYTWVLEFQKRGHLIIMLLLLIMSIETNFLSAGMRSSGRAMKSIYGPVQKLSLSSQKDISTGTLQTM